MPRQTSVDGVTTYLVVGTGAHAPEPIERTVNSAQEAEQAMSALRRVCGRAGKVHVWGRDGREISPDRLKGLVRRELEAKLGQSPGLVAQDSPGPPLANGGEAGAPLEQAYRESEKR